MNQHRTLRSLILAALLGALTAIGAWLQIPVGITSITLQFLFTAFAGVLLGWKWGAVSQLLYVAIGLLGLPVFTQGGGIGYVLQPSFGFLLGLIPAAAVIGRADSPSSQPSRRFSGGAGGRPCAVPCRRAVYVPYYAAVPRLGRHAGGAGDENGGVHPRRSHQAGHRHAGCAAAAALLGKGGLYAVIKKEGRWPSFYFDRLRRALAV